MFLNCQISHEFLWQYFTQQKWVIVAGLFRTDCYLCTSTLTNMPARFQLQRHHVCNNRCERETVWHIQLNLLQTLTFTYREYLSGLCYEKCSWAMQKKSRPKIHFLCAFWHLILTLIWETLALKQLNGPKSQPGLSAQSPISQAKQLLLL